MIYSSISIVKDEQIELLTFPNEDVLSSIKEQVERSLNLKRIMRMANLGDTTSTVLFIDDQGIKQIESSLSKVTDTELILDSCVTIPLNRILHVS
ncbi:hypothetical protein GTQ40_09170 [Flavobacteriaceae bacterium R38]|nr:hypothetical protein [Flavobacteriaceae bacterium R38]